MKKFFHITRSFDRDSIASFGLRPSTAWMGGQGSYVTTNPYSWLHIFEEDGVYSTESVDLWEVDVRSLKRVGDIHPVAEPGEDFVIRSGVSPVRLRLVETLVRAPGSYSWRKADKQNRSHGRVSQFCKADASAQVQRTSSTRMAALPTNLPKHSSVAASYK